MLLTISSFVPDVLVSPCSLSTLEAIFKGNKALSEGYHIAQSSYDWQSYLVLLFDFSGITNKTPEKLAISLHELITKISKSRARLEVLQAFLQKGQWLYSSMSMISLLRFPTWLRSSKNR